MRKYVFYLVQLGYFAFIRMVKPLDEYLISVGTGAALVLCGSMILTEIINSWSLRALSESFRKHVIYLALAAGFAVVATLWQIGTSISSASLGFCIGVFALDMLSVFFGIAYLFLRGALLMQYVSGGSKESRLRLRLEGHSLRGAFVWAGGIALLINMGNLVRMLVLWRFAAL